MLRPVLSMLCDFDSRPVTAVSDNDSIDSNMRQDMLLKIANRCVLVAQQLVHLIVGNVHSQGELLPAPWYSVFCKFPFLSLSCTLSRSNLASTMSPTLE